ncbi:MAG: SOS response-associated peptidase [Acidobacteria bacterium]|nr:MAG: SOS response-associated peptidase [Acidobacteriota bacterium]
MCGRFVLAASPEALERLLDVPVPEEWARPRYNIAPSQPVLACRLSSAQERELVPLRWGLVPRWARDPAVGNRMINARAETAAEKPAFRAAVRARRCLVPADGFYEWSGGAGGRQPYLFRAPGGEPFAFAGLWERWRPPETDEDAAIETCAILTRPADEVVGAVHPRMPVIVPPGLFERWLDPSRPGTELLAELVAAPPPLALQRVPVSRRVNDPRHDDPSCIEPLPG